MPDITAITAAAHAAGAKVVIDGVHLTPHAPVDIAAIGCDVYSTSSYKWYGPHAGITWIEPSLLDRLRAYKVRPAPDAGPGKFMLGTPAVREHRRDRRRRRVPDEHRAWTTIAAHERELFAPLLDALAQPTTGSPSTARTTSNGGPRRWPSTSPGTRPREVAQALAAEQIAVWDGNYYALEAMSSFGVEGAVRAGIAVYVSPDDVDRLIDAVQRL